MKKLRILAIICIVIVSIITTTPVYATPALHENVTSTGDADSIDIYGGEFVAQIFTSEATAHSVTSIKLELKRTGSPGLVHVSLRAVAAGVPTGSDLTTGVLNATAMSTAYKLQEFTMTEYALLPATDYAIIIQLDGGVAATDFINWHQDSGGGGVTAGFGLHSHTSGIAWTSDTPADYLYEIYGNIVMQVKGANVFTDYLVTGDWLITIECVNVYPNYVYITDASRNFNIQLLNPAGTVVLAATTLKSWGDAPAAIYLNPTSVLPLTFGAAYIIRMIGTFVGTPSVQYTLVASDWAGSDLKLLDNWCINTANSMNVYDGNTLLHPYTRKVSGIGYVLTTEGGADFTLAIPAIEAERTTLFETYKTQPSLTLGTSNPVYDNAFTWQNQVGVRVTADATTFGALLGITGKDFLALGFWIIIIGAMLFVFFNHQGSETPIVLVLCIPILLYANYLRVISIQVTLVASAIMALLFSLKFWVSRT